MTVYIATKNEGKFRELSAIVADFGWQARSYQAYGDVAETDHSYVANAALKARALRRQLRAGGIRASVLGDDSGLEVAALDGRPGVRSARYGGSDVTWAERRAKLLSELTGFHADRRAARFICALHYIDPSGRETAVSASYEGTIADTERGQAGFSYDPIFIGADGRTFAELRDDEKNRTSHRYLAAMALLTRLAPNRQPLPS